MPPRRKLLQVLLLLDSRCSAYFDVLACGEYVVGNKVELAFSACTGNDATRLLLPVGVAFMYSFCG